MTNNIMIPNETTDAQMFRLPEMDNDLFDAEDIADDSAGIRPAFRHVKIPTGGGLQFEIPGDDPQNPDYTRTLEGVILYNHPSCAYWAPGKSESDGNTPLCISNDSITGYGTPGGPCALCDFNKYNTGIDSNGNITKGKACKNMRQVYILQSGEFMPLHLTLSPTSLKPFNDFMNISFINRRRPTWASVVQIGLKRIEANPKDYSMATFRKLYDLPAEQLGQMKAFAAAFREQMKESLKQIPMLTDDVVEHELPFAASAPVYQVQGVGKTISSPYAVIDGDRDELPL